MAGRARPSQNPADYCICMSRVVCNRDKTLGGVTKFNDTKKIRYVTHQIFIEILSSMSNRARNKTYSLFQLMHSMQSYPH